MLEGTCAVIARKPAVAAQPLRLGAVVHLAGLLTEAVEPGPHCIDSLPREVIHMLQLDLDWMREHFPDPQKFVNVS